MKVFTIFLTVVTMAVSSTAMEDLAQSYTPVESHLNKRDTANMTWAHADSSQTSCNETDRMNSWSIANWNTVYIKDCEFVIRELLNGTWSMNNLTATQSDHSSGWYWLVPYTTCNLGIHPYNAPSPENITIGDADVKYVISQAVEKFAVNATHMNASYGTLSGCPSQGHNVEWILTNSTANALVSTTWPNAHP